MIEWMYNNYGRNSAVFNIGTSDTTLARTFLIMSPTDGFASSNNDARGPWDGSWIRLQFWRPFDTTKLGLIFINNFSRSGCQHMVRQFSTMRLSTYGVATIGSLGIAALENGLAPTEINTIQTDCTSGTINITISY